MIPVTLNAPRRPADPAANGKLFGKIYIKTNDPLQKYVTVEIVYTVVEAPKPKRKTKVQLSKQWSRKIGGGSWAPNTSQMTVEELKDALKARGVQAPRVDSDEFVRGTLTRRRREMRRPPSSG